MDIAQAVKTCLGKYATFSGRATRSEYWWFVCAAILASFVVGGIDSLLFGTSMPARVNVGSPDIPETDGQGPISTVLSLALLIPMLSAGWRRMHDTGRSGLYLLYPFIVMIGISILMSFGLGTANVLGVMTGSVDIAALVAGATGIIAIIAVFVMMIAPLLVLWWLTRPSQPGNNTYGPNPHEVSS